jgi:hypothetical protein
MPRLFVAVAAAALVSVSLASAAPAPALTLDSAKINAKWKESWLTASLSYSGTVAGAADLEAVLRPVGRAGPPAAAIAFSADGSFSKTVKLPNRLLPGTYRLSIDGTSNGVGLTAVTRDLVNPTPAEGIVDKAWAASRPKGPPVFTVKGPRTQLWAYFHFVVPPKSTKLRVGWHSPSFRWYGQATKPYTPTFASHVATAGGLPLERGVWFVYLWSGSKVVKRARVRIS